MANGKKENIESLLGLRATASEDHYQSFPTTFFAIDEKMAQDIYLRYEGKFLLFLKAGQKWSTSDLKKLEQFGAKDVHIYLPNSEATMTFLSSRLSARLREPSLGVAEKAPLLYSTCMKASELLFKAPKSEAIAKETSLFVGETVNYLFSDRDAFFQLMQHSSENISEFHHGLNASAFAVQLMRQQDKNLSRKLAGEIALGAFLHDIGKSKISSEILNKPGPLDETEWHLVRRHPQYGKEIAASFGKLVPELSQQIIFEHHERLEGNGYPRRVKEPSIYALAVGLSDVFDSMTFHRPYKVMQSSSDSLREILSSQQKDFGLPLITSFIEMMNRKP